MTKEELKAHCEKQVKMCEEWAKGNGREPSGKIYEEHKLILDLIKSLEQQPYEEDVQRVVDYLLKPINKPTTSDDCVSRTQAIEWIENLRQMDKCFGNYEDDYFPLSEVIDRLKNVPSVTPKIPTFEDCVSRQAVNEYLEKLIDGRFDDFMSAAIIGIKDNINAMPPVTPTFPKGATNGDMIKAMFPNAKFDNAMPFTDNRWETIDLDTENKIRGTYKPTQLRVYADWWNAPYKRGNENE